MKLEGKKALILGAGKSGVAAAAFLHQRGAKVALHDRKAIDDWTPEARALKDDGIGLLCGEIPMWLLDQIEIAVVSPGVPTNSIPIRYLERAGAEVLGEVELAARFLKGNLIAITGSNGKTTTTTLVGELLKDANYDVHIGGNIGTPLVSFVDKTTDDSWIVAEISSFQLETTREFHPKIAAVLNVTPDHLDRYDSLTDYAAAKHRIFRAQTANDTAVLNSDDETARSWIKGLQARVGQFSSRTELDEGIFLRGANIILRTSEGEQILASRDDVNLVGRHNLENVMAALGVGLAAGVKVETMRETLRRFRAVEHRLELVATDAACGVRFYNDSKATNVDATLKALEAFADDAGKIILIIGGRSKDAPYAPLAPLLKSRARAVVVIGEDAARIENELRDVALIQRAKTMNDAVNYATQLAQHDDIVLLAPACSSFDMFDNYEARGRAFKEAVKSRRQETGDRRQNTEYRIPNEDKAVSYSDS